MADQERHLRDLRSRSFGVPEVKSYPEPTKAEQDKASAYIQARGQITRRNRRRIK
jgi:hypothetical protein